MLPLYLHIGRSVANVSHHGMLVKHEDEVIELVDAFSIG